MPVSTAKRAAVKKSPGHWRAPPAGISHSKAPAATKKVAKKAAQSTTEAPKTSAIKLPKSLAECADLLYSTKVKRLKLQQEADKLEATESAIKQLLIEQLPKKKASSIGGTMALASLNKKKVPSVKDWTKLYKYIVKMYPKDPGVFSLLSRSVGKAAVEEIWKSGKAVPGVEAFETVTVSCTKLGDS